MVYNPILDGIHGNDAHGHDTAHRHDTEDCCIRLVYPQHALLASRASPCLCFLHLRTCGPCKRFWPQWRALCQSFVDSSQILCLDVPCDEHRAAARELVGDHTFPALLVAHNGELAVVQGDNLSRMGLAELQANVNEAYSSVVLYDDAASQSEAASDAGSLDDLPLEEEDAGFDEGDPDDEPATEEDDEPPDVDDEPLETDEAPRHVHFREPVAEECGCSGPPRAGVVDVVSNDLTLRATHAAPPDEVRAMGHQSDADNRVVVYYFAHWCGHCRTFSEAWNECVERSAAEGQPTKWVVVDCTSEEGGALAREREVHGYPTVHLHHRASAPTAYRDERTAEKLYRWATGDWSSYRGVVPQLMAHYRRR